MAVAEDKISRKKARSSYFSTIVSISLVLFMLGLVALIVLNAKKLSDYAKENIMVSIFLKDNVKPVEVIKMQKTLDASAFVKSTQYIDKEEAKRIYEEAIGNDFEILGYSPLPASIDIHLYAEYAHPDSIAWIEKELRANPKVKEVDLDYKKNLIVKVHKNTEKIGVVLLGFSGLLFIIAIALINNSIRLTIYSKRFLIRSMQLVGATQGFIRRPFVWVGTLHGLFGALIAIALLVATIYLMQEQIPEFRNMLDLELFAALFVIVIALGVLISWICTFFAVRKYLKIKTDQLYY
ncbi:MAG: cell division protein FtsX [Flavobacteriales bacterium]|nr:MAG: cell division protein FtsX [Flavobacteriales bacterium]